MSNKEKIIINSRDYIRHTLNKEYDKAYLASKPFLKPMPRLKYQRYNDNFYKTLMENLFS
jgi:hypothetical protein